MVDFRKMISYDSRQKVARMLAVVNDFSALDRKAQARALLDTARKVYDEGSFKPEHNYSYDEALLLRVIPQIAKRLDPEIRLLDREVNPADDGPHRTPWDQKTDAEIADYTRSCQSNSSLSRAGNGENYEAAMSLVMHWNRGNLVKIATNTLVPRTFDLVVSDDVRPPLTGYQVIYDKMAGLPVLRYEETAEAATEWVRKGLERIRKNPDQGVPGYERLREAVLSGMTGEIEVRKWDDNDLIKSVPLREPEVEESPAP